MLELKKLASRIMSSEPSNQQEGDRENSRSVRSREIYNTIAETVGGVPSLRMNDNVIQAIVIGVTTAVAVAIGGMVGGAAGALAAALLGLILSTLLSGIVLMVIGWVRAFQKMNSGK
jgi:VIT1/CCC1 family predicted Fe2+/Mn2+ transporter